VICFTDFSQRVFLPLTGGIITTINQLIPKSKVFYCYVMNIFYVNSLVCYMNIDNVLLNFIGDFNLFLLFEQIHKNTKKSVKK